MKANQVRIRSILSEKKMIIKTIVIIIVIIMILAINPLTRSDLRYIVRNLKVI